MEGFSFDIAFDDFSVLLQPLIQQHSVGASSEWVTYLHSGQSVPMLQTVPEYQEYIAKIGQDAQLAVLFSPNADMKLVETIGQTVTLANQELLYHQQFLDQETGPATMHKYTTEIEKSLRWLVIQSNIQGPRLES